MPTSRWIFRANNSRATITGQAIISRASFGATTLACTTTAHQNFSNICLRKADYMVKVMHFYLDDSGTRNANHSPGTRPAHGHDWFALGGVILKQEEEDVARARHAKFMA